MKKFSLFIVFMVLSSISLIAYANFCCPLGSEEQCCAERGKVYCPEKMHVGHGVCHVEKGVVKGVSIQKEFVVQFVLRQRYVHG